MGLGVLPSDSAVGWSSCEENAQPGGASCVSIEAMSNDGRDETDGMDARDDQALWTLLGRQEPTPKASPYFARRVLREVTLAEERRADGWRRLWSRGWPGGVFGRRSALCSGVISGACATLLLVMVYRGQSPGPARGTPPGETTMAPSAAPVESLSVAPNSAAIQVEATPAGSPVQDVEVIADLDNALQREESRLWTEDTARF